MGYAKIYAAQTHLFTSHIIHIEADISRGLHSFVIVGLANKAVEESKDRVSAAIKNSGFISPKQHNRKVVIALAPANMRKEGPLFDLGIAMAYLRASNEINFIEDDCIFIGELSLNGELKPVRGVLPIALHAERMGFKKIFVSKENARQASYAKNITVYGASSLLDVINHVTRKRILEKTEYTYEKNLDKQDYTDFANIRGNEKAKRAISVAIAGGHNIALYGAPGSGKTMLAHAIKGIMPPLTEQESIEVTSIYSLETDERHGLIEHAPFRAPHHSSSIPALLGGGNPIRVGEITRAHHGILFLDEFTEFNANVIEALRQPLENKTIQVNRASGTAVYPANIILVCAMNLCPCGFYKTLRCRCHPSAIRRYQQKISGPIIDRIDMWVEVSKYVQNNHLLQNNPAHNGINTINKNSESLRNDIINARSRQYSRFPHTKNALLSGEHLKKLSLEHDALLFFEKIKSSESFSERSADRVLKIAQTIADIDGFTEIKKIHIAEAFMYRLDTTLLK